MKLAGKRKGREKKGVKGEKEEDKKEGNVWAMTEMSEA